MSNELNGHWTRFFSKWFYLSVILVLTGLMLYEISKSSISNISIISNLTSLTDFRIDFNSISDISALSGLLALTALDLQGNSISDISPLVANSGLDNGDWVDLRDNPLNDTSINAHIPNLEGKGVTVNYTP